MKDDPTIERIRKVRHKISETCQHDPGQLIRYYMQLQKQHQGRLLTVVVPPGSGRPSQRDK